MSGTLYYGDNLEVLRHKIASESVDLIYLDPPFNSDRTYNLLHKESQAQQEAFFDTWHWDDKAEHAYAELTGHAPLTVHVPEPLTEMMRTLRSFLGDERRDTMAYLAMMAIRLIEMRRALRPEGSLYLHCDPTASHYLKLILDAIFGSSRFQNEIIWKRTSAHNSAHRYGPVHDVVFFYSKSETFTWNGQFQTYDPDYVATFFDQTDEDGQRWKRGDLTGPGVRAGDSGKPWRGIDVTAKGRHWQPASYVYDRYRRLTGKELNEFPLIERLDQLDKIGMIHWPEKKSGMPRYKCYLTDMPGLPVQDVWTDIRPLHNLAEERIGFATQKPVALLERILLSSSNPGDLVLDPFCGCGTTVEAAERRDRRWIGIDTAIRAIDVIKDRLDKAFPARRVWKEIGEPSDLESAAHLAETNPYDFQWWAVRRLGAMPPRGEKKKGKDGGIDGEMKLRDFDSDRARRVLVSVKGGRNLTPDMVKALKSTVDIEKADFGILVTMHEPSDGMRQVARDCGVVPWASVAKGEKLKHRIMLVTVAEILGGRVQLPGVNLTPHTASSPPPAEPRKGETLRLPGIDPVPRSKGRAEAPSADSGAKKKPKGRPARVQPPKKRATGTEPPSSDD